MNDNSINFTVLEIPGVQRQEIITLLLLHYYLVSNNLAIFMDQ